MTLHTYSSSLAFLADVQESLEADETVNSLMLGIALAVGQTAYAAPPYYAAIHKDSRVVAAALMTPPYPLQITGTEANNRDILLRIVQHLRDARIVPPGIHARKDIADAFADIYTSLYEVQATTEMNMRLYRLDKVLQQPQPPGRLRKAEEADTELIATWCEAFMREAMPRDPLRSAAAFARQKIADHELFLWDNGEPVSMAARARPTRHSCTVNFVYTPPEQRARGYAMACTAALSQYLINSGYTFCTLFTDLDNPTSNSIYQRIGYQAVCDFTKYRFNARPA